MFVWVGKYQKTGGSTTGKELNFSFTSVGSFVWDKSDTSMISNLFKNSVWLSGF